jgi:hypothetical protein
VIGRLALKAANKLPEFLGKRENSQRELRLTDGRPVRNVPVMPGGPGPWKPYNPSGPGPHANRVIICDALGHHRVAADVCRYDY